MNGLHWFMTWAGGFMLGWAAHGLWGVAHGF
jgi:hypothetical protein